eukprot:TRINITY_DN11627_c0_g1_i1.p1 TRINITY_DN11627_c0_g1~~TRINITY_DN11627_c0_g1_i1.p1  ORF type:complete len:393 (-),score=84.13 TRINITY_DN11627_c0_g1_i1:137-1315(-)
MGIPDNITVYETWERPDDDYYEYKGQFGNVKSWLCGLFIIAPDFGKSVAVFFAYTIGFMLFWFQIGTFLMNEGWWFIPLLVSLTYIFTVYCHCAVTFRDPGILPRSSYVQDGKKIEFYEQPPLMQDALVDGVYQKVKHCSTCWIYRPPRAAHCPMCNNCVEVFDHHCQWLGNCIGHRNYKPFVGYLFGISLWLFVLFFSVIFGIYQKSIVESSLKDALDAFPTIMILIPADITFFFLVHPLLRRHIDLISYNLTTRELFKPYTRSEENTQKIWKNWKDFLAKPTPPSNLKDHSAMKKITIINPPPRPFDPCWTAWEDRLPEYLPQGNFLRREMMTSEGNTLFIDMYETPQEAELREQREKDLEHEKNEKKNDSSRFGVEETFELLQVDVDVE